MTRPLRRRKMKSPRAKSRLAKTPLPLRPASRTSTSSITSHGVRRAHAEEPQRLTERDLHRLDEPEARPRERRIRVVDDAVVAVKAVERAGELEGVDGEQVHAAVRDDLLEQLRKLLAEADEIALAL